MISSHELRGLVLYRKVAHYQNSAYCRDVAVLAVNQSCLSLILRSSPRLTRTPAVGHYQENEECPACNCSGDCGTDDKVVRAERSMWEQAIHESSGEYT
jgi:hypothetical protein